MTDLALFDFDGTITYNDTYTEFIYYAVEKKRLALGKILLSPLIVGYKLGFVSGPTIRSQISCIGFRGREVSELISIGETYFDSVITGKFRQNATERLDWHRSRGDQIVIVSASLNVYLQKWCEKEGFDLICTTLEAKNSRYTGRYVDGDCSGEEKARRIRLRYDLKNYHQIYAYGDTPEDHAMLELANKRFYQWQQLC